MGRYVGTSVKRVEDPRFIQGKGRYVANIQLPGMVHVAIKRSPEAHARITGMDTSAASAMDGVLAVFTGQDFKDGGCGSLPCGWLVPDTKVPDRPIVVTDRVCHVGDSVAVVVAEDPYVAADAVEAIEVDYEPLPTVVDARGAMDEGAPLVHAEIEDNVSYHWALGDQEACDKAFAEADEVVEIELVNQRLIPTAMEPRAAAAQWDGASEEMTVWTTSQNPHPIRLLLSAFTLGIPESKLRVISPDVGGGFGSKIFHYPEEVIVPWVARAVGRPARWVATRTESQMTDSQGRDHVTVAKLAMTSGGTFTGLDVETWANQGAYLSTFAPLIPTALYITLLSGNYKMPGVFGKVHGTLTNTVPVDAYRGAGRPEAAYLVERLVDLAAARLGRDPLELRRQNAIPKEDFPYQTPVAFLYDSGDYDRLMAKAADNADYAGMRAAQADARGQGKLRGVGVVCCIEASGPAPSAVAGSLGSAVGFWESGEVRVHPTGQISVFTGSHAHGQGHETTLAQVVADELGVPIESVEVVHGDTGRVNFGMGTYGSRSACVGGSALVRSAEKVRAKVLQIGAHLLEGRRGGRGLRPGHRPGPREGLSRERKGLRRDGVRRLHRAQPARGHGAGARFHELLRPGELHLPGEFAHLRGRGLLRHLGGAHPPLRGGGRRGQGDQPHDRGGPAPGRHRPGGGPGAHRDRRLFRRRAAPLGNSARVRGAARRPPAGDRGGPHRDPVAPQPARGQGRRRDGHDRRHPRGGERGARRAGSPGSHPH